MTPRSTLTTDEVADLLGAYALDACTPEETEAIEAVLAENAELAAEAMRLVRAASWIGATETLAPPTSLRDRIVAAATPGHVAIRDAGPDPALDAYMSLSSALAEVIGELPDSVLDEPTANGLSARDLVVHVAAQESLLAHEAGVSILPELTETDIDARTAALLPDFAGQSIGDAAALWQRAVDANRSWALANAGGEVNWRGIRMTRDDAIIVRAFETWIHTDDLRRTAGWDLAPPAPEELAVMSEFASRILPFALGLTDRSRPGKTARLVLSGPGGGDWLVPMGGGDPAGEPDVTLTVDVVEWCRLVGERIDPSEMSYHVDGDAALADDLVAAAPALATL